jgi:hypothetical protein
VRTHGDWEKLKKMPGYQEAKAGNPEIASDLARAMVRPNLARDLANRHPDAIIVYPHAEEATGKNALPVAYAGELELLTGLPVERRIVQTNRPHRTGSTALHRLMNRPEFDGPVEKGREFVIVDDVVAQGGTMNQLRKYIEGRGGKVVEMTALAHATPESVTIALNPGTVAALTRKFGADNLNTFLNDHAIASHIEELTESEAQYLLRWDSLDALRDRGASPGLRGEVSESEGSDRPAQVEHGRDLP